MTNNTNKETVTSEDGFDNFLDDATHTVHNLWLSYKGRPLNSDELYALNDALTAYFSDKK